MSAAAIPSVPLHRDRLTAFEAEFLRTVLEHRGLFRVPTEAEFAEALSTLRRYDELCLANPGYERGFAPWLGEENAAALRAKAFVMFGTIKPTPAQWHRAHGALFGPLLCDTCG